MPLAILLDSNNKGYCRVILDEFSKIFLLENLKKIKEDINRSYIWRIFMDSVIREDITP